MPVFCQIDDKHIPLYRIVWISDLPHFCGDAECQREGQYEIRLEHERIGLGHPSRARRSGRGLAGLVAGTENRKTNRMKLKIPKLTRSEISTCYMSTFEDDRYQLAGNLLRALSRHRRPTLKEVEKRLATLEQALHAGKSRRRRAGQVRIGHGHLARRFRRPGRLLHRRRRGPGTWRGTVQELAATIDPGRRRCLKQLKQYDGRFDVLHFEQVGEPPRKTTATTCSIPVPCWRSWRNWPASPADWPSIRSREPFSAPKSSSVMSSRLCARN